MGRNVTARTRRVSMGRVATIGVLLVAVVMAATACGSSESAQAIDSAVPSSVWAETERGTVRDKETGRSVCADEAATINLDRNQKHAGISATGWGTGSLRLEFGSEMHVENIIAGDTSGNQGNLGRSLDAGAMEVVELRVDEFGNNLPGTAPNSFSWIQVCRH